MMEEDDRLDLAVMEDEDLLVPLLCGECDVCAPSPACADILAAVG